MRVCVHVCVPEGEHTKQTPAASIEVLFISIYNSPLSSQMFSVFGDTLQIKSAVIRAESQSIKQTNTETIISYFGWMLSVINAEGPHLNADH